MSNPVWKHGRVKNVFLGYEDHGILTISVMIEGDGNSWGQGFGLFGLGAHSRDSDQDELERLDRWVQSLLAVFGVHEWDSIKGRPVWALSSSGMIHAIAPENQQRVMWARPEEEEKYKAVTDIEEFNIFAEPVA